MEFYFRGTFSAAEKDEMINFLTPLAKKWFVGIQYFVGDGRSVFAIQKR